ncbi:unnamed protein product [Effrenium voratum]|uniref:PPPDE domain-containing protein n=1 Tax=Effrenium voratum TaxID=2562239 RepID=A0AA36ND83_9DINO|nr:unnamed protein product [Effrenium voratum]
MEKMDPTVTLHIYHLPSGWKYLNQAMEFWGCGAFHLGVEVYGKEYSFQASQHEFVDGIQPCKPKMCRGYIFERSLQLGPTMLEPKQVNDLINRMRKEYSARDYDLYTRNCCHFSNHFCKELGVDSVPPEFFALSEAARKAKGAVCAIDQSRKDVLGALSAWMLSPFQACCVSHADVSAEFEAETI